MEATRTLAAEASPPRKPIPNPVTNRKRIASAPGVPFLGEVQPDGAAAHSPGLGRPPPITRPAADLPPLRPAATSHFWSLNPSAPSASSGGGTRGEANVWPAGSSGKACKTIYSWGTLGGYERGERGANTRISMLRAME